VDWQKGPYEILGLDFDCDVAGNEKLYGLDDDAAYEGERLSDWDTAAFDAHAIRSLGQMDKSH
jgi:hypothetical protein